jgi:hypothetical protein
LKAPRPALCCLIAAALAAVACGKGEPVEDRSELAAADENSQVRQPGESFADAELRFSASLSDIQRASFLNLHSVRSLAASTSAVDFSVLPEWSSVEQAMAAFEAVRDRRFLANESQPDFMRRSTWLYPDNGCYARADLLVRNLAFYRYPAAGKIFVFGDLALVTRNSPSGYVEYWYHVAVALRVAGTVLVLDPAVEATRPLQVGEWIARLQGNSQSLTLTICKGAAYGPFSSCLSGVGAESARALDDQARFLDAEWQRLLDLGRNPVEELGDAPPWL